MVLVAVSAVLPVTLGTVIGSGPLEMTRLTVASRLSSVPVVGVVEMTSPLGTSSS